MTFACTKHRTNVHYGVDSVSPPSEEGNAHMPRQKDEVRMKKKSWKKHENRVQNTFSIALPKAELSQEMSIPRGARRLDLVYDLQKEYDALGPLNQVLSGRIVLVEAQSSTAYPVHVWSACVGGAWLAWKRLEHQGEESADHWGTLRDSRLPPVALVFAPQVSPAAHSCVGGLRPWKVPGVWATPEIDTLGGLILVDATIAENVPGMGLWHFMLMPDTRDPDGRLRVLTRDPALPTLLKVSLTEAVMEHRIESNSKERRSASERIFSAGELQGERSAFLAVAERFFPERLDALREIENVEELQSEVTDALDEIMKRSSS